MQDLRICRYVGRREVTIEGQKVTVGDWYFICVKKLQISYGVI